MQLATKVFSTALNMGGSEILCGTFIPSRSGAYSVNVMLSNLPANAQILTVRCEHVLADATIGNYRAAMVTDTKNAAADTTFSTRDMTPLYLVSGEKLNVYARCSDAGATSVTAQINIIAADGALAGFATYEYAIRNLLRLYGGSCWPLSDLAGPVLDIGSGGYNGTVSATGVTLQSPGPILAGQRAKCALFNGSSGYIARANPYNPSVANTVSLWCNTTNIASATQQTIFACDSGDTSRYQITEYNNLTRVGLYTGYDYACSGSAIPGWHHIAAAKINGSIAPILYINGVAQVGTTASGNYSTNSELTIGCRSKSDVHYSPYPGSLAYVSVISATLTATEVLNLYNAGVRAFTQTTVS